MEYYHLFHSGCDNFPAQPLGDAFKRDLFRTKLCSNFGEAAIFSSEHANSGKYYTALLKSNMQKLAPGIYGAIFLTNEK